MLFKEKGAALLTPLTRKENYLNEIVGWGNTAPEKPLTPEEFFFAAILGEAVQVPDLSNASRYELFLAKIAGYNVKVSPPTYTSPRLEFFLAKAAGMDVVTPVPLTKEEIFWADYALIVEKELSGIPPLTFNAVAGTLKNYRIYGNTVDGESVGGRTANLFANLWKKGYIRADNGCEEQTDGFICSGFFPVEYGQTYSISRNINVGYDNVRGYRDDGSFIGAGTDVCDVTNPFPSGATKIGAFTVTNENVAFIRFNDSSNNLDMKYMIVDGTYTEQTMPDYEPYGYKVPVTVEGKNLFDGELAQGYYSDVAGSSNDLISFDKRVAGTSFIPVSAGSTMALTYESTIGITKHLIYYYNNNKELINAEGWYINGSTFTIPNNVSFIRIVWGAKVSGNYVTLSVANISNIMLNEGSTPLPYEPYHAPVTTPIYLPEPIKMIGDEAEYIDYGEQKLHRIGTDDIDVTLPALPTLAGTNVLSVGTAVQPSKVYVKYKGERQ